MIHPSFKTQVDSPDDKSSPNPDKSSSSDTSSSSSSTDSVTSPSTDSTSSSTEDSDHLPVCKKPRTAKTLNPSKKLLKDNSAKWRTAQTTSTYFRASKMWKIANFTSLTQPVCSNIFVAKEQLKSDNTKHPEDISFYIQMDPDHKYQKSSYVVFKVLTCNLLKNCITVRYRFSVIDASGERCLTQDSKTKLKQNTLGLSSNGFFSLSREYILNSESGLLKDDALTILCEIDIIDDNFKEEITNHQQLALTANVQQDYATLLESGICSDVLLVVGKDGAKKEINAHKCILAWRSPVFGAMFEHRNTKEAQDSRVEIADIQVDAFDQFIRYIYNGKVTQMDKYAQDLLTFADKYQIDCLKSQCSNYLSSRINMEQVSSMLVLADLHNAFELKSKCVDYIVENAVNVMATKDFHLLTNMPAVMFELFQKLAFKKSNT